MYKRLRLVGFFLFFFPISLVFANENAWTVSLGTKSDLGSAQEFSKQVISTFPDLKICLNKSGDYVITDGTVTQDNSTVTTATMDAQTKGFKGAITQIEPNKCFGPEGFLANQAIKEDPATPNITKNTPKADVPPLRIKPADFIAKQNEKKKNISSLPGKNDNGLILQDEFVTVFPELITSVWLSSRDINRITCEGGVPVADVIYSDEKGLTHNIKNDTVWLKYLTLESSLTKERHYRNDPTELYVLCGSDKTTYTMIVTPKLIDAQKIILKTGNKNIKKNQSLFKGLSTEEKILKFIKEAYNNNYGASYEVKKLEGGRVEYGNLEISPSKEIRIYGEGLRLTEFTIWNNPDCKSPSPTAFDEKVLLSLGLIENPLLISIQKHLVNPGEKIKAFVIDFAQ